MIAFNFEYYRPQTIEEAVEAYQMLDTAGKKPIYYSGGTEIISMARANNIFTQAVIDLKAIIECNLLENDGHQLVIGSCVTLTKIAEANQFPLLGKSVKRIADHTIQGKITLGGNICGTIIYKEALLPLLVADASVVVAGPQGIKNLSIHELYQEQLLLQKGEFIVQFIIGDEYLNLPFAHVKRTKQDKVDYPLITAVGLKRDNQIRVALSGVCKFPFRSRTLEEAFNKDNLPLANRIDNAVNNLPGPILNDLIGSAEYREFVLKRIFTDISERLEGENVSITG